jgi:hypothetical protein
MINQDQVLTALIKLGSFFREFIACTSEQDPDHDKNDPWIRKFEEQIIKAGHKNGWFTKENVYFAIKVWGACLQQQNLDSWISNYSKPTTSKDVAIIMAGNIPLVGFHDLLSVLLTCNRAIVKCSSNDTILIPFVAEVLFEQEPQLKNYIEFKDGLMGHFDAVIATGSTNTSRYFEYYFANKPHIIRKNRNSVAVLSGQETADQLQKLADDIFLFYGLGCRSVSKIYVPVNYDFSSFMEAMEKYAHLSQHPKYANNYDYNKAVYLMSKFPFLDNGFFMLKEDKGYASPIGSAFYEYYSDQASLKSTLLEDAQLIQCIVANEFIENEIAFGQTQTPNLHDFADGVDTVDFLLKTS